MSDQRPLFSLALENSFVNIRYYSQNPSLSFFRPRPDPVRSLRPTRFNRRGRPLLAGVQPRRFPICASKRKRGLGASLSRRERRSIATTWRAFDAKSKTDDANRSSAARSIANRAGRDFRVKSGRMDHGTPAVVVTHKRPGQEPRSSKGAFEERAIGVI